MYGLILERNEFTFCLLYSKINRSIILHLVDFNVQRDLKEWAEINGRKELHFEERNDTKYCLERQSQWEWRHMVDCEHSNFNSASIIKHEWTTSVCLCVYTIKLTQYDLLLLLFEFETFKLIPNLLNLLFYVVACSYSHIV